MVINIESLALVPLQYSFQSNEDLSIKVVIINEFSSSRITQPINENGTRNLGNSDSFPINEKEHNQKGEGVEREWGRKKER